MVKLNKDKSEEEIAADFSGLCKMPYLDQATWFLNGFFDEFTKSEEGPELVWKVCHKFVELDKRGEKGNELDEFEAHRLFETFTSALSVMQMRTELKKIDVDANGKMSLLEYLVWKYNKTLFDAVDAAQGDDPEALNAAQKKFEEVNSGLTDVQQRLSAQKEAIAESEKSCKEATDALEVVKAEEAKVKAAEAENQAAMDEVDKQEKAYKDNIAALEAKMNDPNLGVVKKNRAAAELNQAKEEDPMTLRKAKIAAGTSLKKAQKQRKGVETAVAGAQSKKEAADADEASCKAAADELEKAAAELNLKMAAAKEEIDDLKRKGGIAKGGVWWMERTLIEAEKYLPKSKRKGAKSGRAST